MTTNKRTTEELTIQLMQLLVEATMKGVILIEGRELLNRLSISRGKISSFLTADDRAFKISEVIGWTAITETEGRRNHVYLIYRFNKKHWKAYRKAIIENSPNVWASPRSFSGKRLIEHVIRTLKAHDAPAFISATEALQQIECSSIPTSKLLTYSGFSEALRACQLSMKKNAQGRWIFTLANEKGATAA